MLKLPLLLVTESVIRTFAIGWLFAVLSVTVTTGFHCVALLTDVFVGFTANFTTDVKETGPMSLSPPTRPVPPPPSLNIIVAAWAGWGASHVARVAAAANSEELDCVALDAVPQKLSASSGERMTGVAPEWSCRILAFGSEIEQTPTLIIGLK